MEQAGRAIRWHIMIANEIVFFRAVPSIGNQTASGMVEAFWKDSSAWLISTSPAFARIGSPGEKVREECSVGIGAKSRTCMP
jgi:hypothetical protein